MASELSKNHSLLIIDKNKDIPYKKYWLTDITALENNPELSNYINTRYSFMDFIAFNDYKLRCNGQYILWDTVGLIQYLKDKIEHQGGIFSFSQRFYSYSYNRDSIAIKANDKKYTSKLLVDCTGYESPIAASNDLLKIKGYYLLHGATIKLKQRIDPICLANVVISSKPRYLEVFPTSENYAHTTLIVPQKYLGTNSDIYKEFKFITSHTEYNEYFDLNAEVKGYLGGIVPVGSIQSQSLERIFFYGESALMNPPATGTCFTKLLNNYKFIAASLSSAIKSNKLTPKDLSFVRKSFTENFNTRFQLNLYVDVLNFNSNTFYALLKRFKNLPDSLLNEILFSDINLKTLLYSIGRKRILRNFNFYFLKILIKSIFS